MSGTKIAMPQTNSFQSGALSFMSCTSGRESSPLDENESYQTAEFKTETKKKRFHPLRNLRRMFRRKTRRSSISTESYQSVAVDNTEITSTNLEQRSCSTSRLQEENLTQNLIKNSRLNPGLSLSHDSIFTPDRADSGLSSSDLENSSLSITVLTPPSKECPMKSQSSCSETSLISIGSSEVELSPVRGGKISELDLGTTAYTLSHSAARHKMAVKPRRNYGAPRSRRRTMTTKSPLPITPELSEEGAATGRNSPPLDSSMVESPNEMSPKCDKQEAKISWSDIAVEFNAKETEDKNSVKAEDETDTNEEESTAQRSESFFGRFLSRRSDKKKKLLQESNPEENTEEKGNFVKKFSKNVESKGVSRKIPNRRQRMEPVAIPSTSCPNKYETWKDKEEVSDRKISGSVSPPKSYWPNQMTTSRSMSPPKVIWPENSNASPKSEPAVVSDGGKVSVSPNSQIMENVYKDWKNPNFMKELTVSINSFAKEKSGKRENEEEGEETVSKIQRQHSEDVTPRKSVHSPENVIVPPKEFNSAESVENVNSPGEENVPAADESTYIVVKTLPSFSTPFDTIHDGYENIQIIEQVKQEVMNVSKAQPVVVKTKPESIESEETETKTTKPEVTPVKMETEKPTPEKDTKIVSRVKPAVSEKPKDLKRATAVPEFLRMSPTRREQKTPEETDIKNNENITPRTKATLIERRKSELLLLTEIEEKETKTRLKPLKKQTSFSEMKVDKGVVSESTEKMSPSCQPERESSTEKTEPEEVVVLRKKSVPNTHEEQPELMKVFARRSLKVREGEKIFEEMQRSRDSDKENEAFDSPKEETRKKVATPVEEKKETDKTPTRESGRILPKEKPTEVKIVDVTPLKPEMNVRKNVLHRYGRSLSENNGKTKEETEQKREFVLEENKMNKIKTPTEETISVKLEKEEEKGETEEEEVETGFKRIQQRKAEWERRAQQGAK